MEINIHPYQAVYLKCNFNISQWSYGVLLWEIFTCGELPYNGIENSEIENFVVGGNRLQRPEISPQYM